MQTVRGNLLEYLSKGVVVIPINIGWKRDGRNVMGRGVALQIARRLPWLEAVAGECCQRDGAAMGVVPVFRQPTTRLVLFPTKPLNTAAPQMSWSGAATLDRVEKSAASLRFLVERADPFPETAYYLPLVGCGNGGLLREEVLPVLEQHLCDDRFVLVER